MMCHTGLQALCVRGCYEHVQDLGSQGILSGGGGETFHEHQLQEVLQKVLSLSYAFKLQTPLFQYKHYTDLIKVRR